MEVLIINLESFENCFNTEEKEIRMMNFNKMRFFFTMYYLIIIENIDSDEFRYIVLHELSHLKRKDIFINWIVTLLQCIYWFNPIVLYGLFKMKQDCELACDTHVISYLESLEGIRYGDTLIKTITLSNDKH